MFYILSRLYVMSLRHAVRRSMSPARLPHYRYLSVPSVPSGFRQTGWGLVLEIYYRITVVMGPIRFALWANYRRL